MSSPFSAFLAPAPLPDLPDAAAQVRLRRPLSASLTAASAAPAPRHPRVSTLHLDWIDRTRAAKPYASDPDVRAEVIRAAARADQDFRRSAHKAADAWAAELAALRTNRTSSAESKHAVHAPVSPLKAAMAPTSMPVAPVAAPATAGPTRTELDEGQQAFFARMARLDAIVAGTLIAAPDPEVAGLAPSSYLSALAQPGTQWPTIDATVSGPTSVPLQSSPPVISKPPAQSTIREPVVSAGAPDSSPTAKDAKSAPKTEHTQISSKPSDPSDADLANALAKRKRQLASTASSAPDSSSTSRRLGSVALASAAGSVSGGLGLADSQAIPGVSVETKNFVVFTLLAMFVSICLALGEGFQGMTSNLHMII